MARKPKKSTKASPCQLRIIGGAWRGRVLQFEAAEGLRPTGNRLRETLFNWLMPIVPGASCLDVFAGSGALGLEALSRGAAHCTFVELNCLGAKALTDNLALLGSDAHEVRCTEALTFLEQSPEQMPGAPYDVVFVDPPFTKGLWQGVIERLARLGVLAPGAAVYVELPRQEDLIVPLGWHCHRQKQAGNVNYRLYLLSETS